MDSETFLNLYLENEEDWCILDSYYILVSWRIRVHKNQQIGTIDDARNILMPDSATLFQDTKKDYKQQYLHQLQTSDSANAYLAHLIKGSIKKNYNIIFLCSKSEGNGIEGGSYLDYLAYYIMSTFKYPVYNYKKFVKKKTSLISYDEEETLRICKEIGKREKQKRKERERSSNQGLIEYRSRLETKSKKSLQKKLEKYNIYVTDETKSEMIDLLVELRKDI